MAGNRLKKILKISGISLAGLLVFVAILPELFPGYFASQIKGLINENIEGKVDFKKARLSILRHFPSLTLSLDDFLLKGSAPFSNDTLAAGRELAFGLDLTTIFSEKLSINEFYLEDALLNLQADSLGNANYNVVKSSPDSLPLPEDSAGGSASLRIKKIIIRNTRLVYNDRSLPMLLSIGKMDYTGKGDLTKDIVDLASELDATGVNFSYDGEQYAINKNVSAGLVTRINTGNLELSFTRNDLKINQLPVDFKGFIRFPESGYDIDLRFISKQANLADVVSVLPPEYLEWMSETELKGTADLFLNLVGPYRANPETYPDLSAGIDLANGFVKHSGAPVPISGMGMHMQLGMPGLSTDSFFLDMDTLHMAMGNGFVKGNLHMKGASPSGISSRFYANASLAEWVKAAGVKNLQLAGKLDASVAMDPAPAGKEKTLPIIHARVNWANGMLKTEYYPEPVSNISLAVVVENNTGTYRDMVIDLQPIRFDFAGKPFSIEADVKNFDNLQYDVTSKGTLDLGRLSKVFRTDTLGVAVQGLVETDLRLQGTQADAMAGRLSRLNNSGTLVLRDIIFSGKYLPHPLVVETGEFRARQDKLVAENLLLSYGRNRLRLKGYYQNLFPYLLGTGPLEGGLKVQSDQLHLEDFMAAIPASGEDSTTATKPSAPVATPQSSSGVVMIPDDLSLKLDANIKEAWYEGMKMENLKGEAVLDKGKLLLNNASMRLAGSTTLLNATYEPQSPAKAQFGFDIKADSFDIQRYYREVPLFAQMAPAAKTVKGQVSLKYKLAGRLNAGMMPVMPSLKGGGTLSLHNVQVNGMKLFSAVARKTGKDSINNPNLKAVNLNTTIANNVMTLERTKMKVMGFRPRIEGQATLDGKLNLRFRLGLPPFGIIGIPMTITGTMDNPKVEMRKGKEEDELDETDDDEAKEN